LSLVKLPMFGHKAKRDANDKAYEMSKIGYEEIPVGTTYLVDRPRSDENKEVNATVVGKHSRIFNGPHKYGLSHEPMGRTLAHQIIHGETDSKTVTFFSTPDKLKGEDGQHQLAFDIPAITCILGSILAGIDGTICSVCYARVGRFVMPIKFKIMYQSFQNLKHPRWVEAFNWVFKNDYKYDEFRWFSSGDLQGTWMLRNIANIALANPDIRFWLPTHEVGMVMRYVFEEKGIIPKNLIIKISDTFLDEDFKVSPFESEINLMNQARDMPYSNMLGEIGMSGVTTVEGEANCPADKNEATMCGECHICNQPGLVNLKHKVMYQGHGQLLTMSKTTKVKTKPKTTSTEKEIMKAMNHLFQTERKSHPNWNRPRDPTTGRFLKNEESE